MPAVNGYTLLSYIKAMRDIVSADAPDDAYIDRSIASASRLFDNACGGRVFYPSIKTRLYDIPQDRRLWLGYDLLEVLTLTNGDGTVLTTADYVTLDPNETPHGSILLRDYSDVIWETDANGSEQQVISVAGVWGCRRDYPRGWVLADTLGAAIVLTSTLSFTTVGSALLVPGQIIKIDTELMIVNTSVTTTTTVLKRGENGSTAATHLINAPIYVWEPQEDVRAAVEDIVLTAYNKRFGVGMEAGAVATVTAAGVVLTPKDITDYAKTVAKSYSWIY